MPKPDCHRIGPIDLAEGVLPRHVYCYLFAAFISIGLFTYLIALTPYVMRVNLGLDPAEFGSLSGKLQFYQELVILAVIGWWGAMSDRFGRRPVYIAGFIVMAIAYASYSFARSETELIAYRLVFALGIAATSALLSAILADYPREHSRGKLTALAFTLNGIGAIIFFVGLTKLPAFFSSRGYNELWSGHLAFIAVAMIALIGALVMTGLKPGRPQPAHGLAGREQSPPVWQLMARGLAAAKNPRIAVAYFSSFAARADMAIITIFLILWVEAAGVNAGMSPTDAAARAGMAVGIANLAAVLWAPVFGILADRINRLTLLVIGFSLATAGYFWVAAQSDILTWATVPALLLMGIGQSSTILSATVLLGQEAPAAIRGSAFGMQSFFGALGILVMSLSGGYLYDHFGGPAPFYAIAAANGLVLIAAFALRRREWRGEGLVKAQR